MSVMGMFDWYEPIPVLACPVCGATLGGWQGSDADSALFVWRQGLSTPVEWRVDEELRIAAALAAAQLPPSFSIVTYDSEGHGIVAVGAAPDGRWSTTTLQAVTMGHTGRKGRHFTRLLWGEAPWLTKAARDR